MNTKYKILLLKEQKKIGEVVANPDFSDIKIYITLSMQKEYKPVLERLIRNIIEREKLNCSYNNLRIKNSTKMFWAIFTQSLMLDLGILITE